MLITLERLYQAVVGTGTSGEEIMAEEVLSSSKSPPSCGISMLLGGFAINPNPIGIHRQANNLVYLIQQVVFCDVVLYTSQNLQTKHACLSMCVCVSV